MDPLTQQLFLASAGAGKSFPDPSTIGTAAEGGYFGGLISTSGNGVATHALIVAPAATGASGTGYTTSTLLKYQDPRTTTTATSTFNGYNNTYGLLAGSDSQAADFCMGLTIGGYSDWYLPAHHELEIIYFHLKPTTTSNHTNVSVGSGVNSYAVPARTSTYTSSAPSQTTVSAFQSGGSEAFPADQHWSSTEYTAVKAFFRNFDTGELGTTQKQRTRRIRAIRKVAV